MKLVFHYPHVPGKVKRRSFDLAMVARVVAVRSQEYVEGGDAESGSSTELEPVVYGECLDWIYAPGGWFEFDISAFLSEGFCITPKREAAQLIPVQVEPAKLSISSLESVIGAGGREKVQGLHKSSWSDQCMAENQVEGVGSGGDR